MAARLVDILLQAVNPVIRVGGPGSARPTTQPSCSSDVKPLNGYVTRSSFAIKNQINYDLYLLSFINKIPLFTQLNLQPIKIQSHVENQNKNLYIKESIIL